MELKILVLIQVTKNMAGVVKGLDKAVQSMELQKVNWSKFHLLKREPTVYRQNPKEYCTKGRVVKYFPLLEK